MSRVMWMLVAGVLAMIGLPALAQEYPARPVKIIVPFAAGGPADIYARFLGQRLEGALGAAVHRRRSSRRGIGDRHRRRGEERARRLHPALMSNTQTVNESLLPNKPYALMRDFVPVAPVNYSDLVLVVHPVGAGENSRRADRSRQIEAGQAQLRVVRTRARLTTWRASCSRRWRASTSCTSRTREARKRAPIRSAGRST